VYQISCAHHTVEAVFQVHQGPVIALAVESGLCVTAGQDRQMRVWRLDFTAHLLEVGAPSSPCSPACIHLPALQAVTVHPAPTHAHAKLQAS